MTGDTNSTFQNTSSVEEFSPFHRYIYNLFSKFLKVTESRFTIIVPYVELCLFVLFVVSLSFVVPMIFIMLMLRRGMRAWNSECQQRVKFHLQCMRNNSAAVRPQCQRFNNHHDVAPAAPETDRLRETVLRA